MEVHLSEVRMEYRNSTSYLVMSIGNSRILEFFDNKIENVTVDLGQYGVVANA